MPFFFLGSILILFLLQRMLVSLVPDLKQVLTPALVRARFMQYDWLPGMNEIQAKGLYSSSLLWSSLKGRTSNRLSGMASGAVFLLLLVNLFRFFFRLGCGRGLVLSSYGSKLGSVMAVVFEKVKKKRNFFLCLFWCGTELVGTT